MHFHKVAVLGLLATSVGVAQAWVNPQVSRSISGASKSSFTTRIASTTPDNKDEEDKTSYQETSFDDAGAQLLDDENEERARMMSTDSEDLEFEQKKDEYEAIREAIRARTAEIGVEKSVVTAKLIEEANQRAASGQSVEGLDLSQITGSLQPPPVSGNDDDDAFELPSMFFNPEEKLTEEQKKEVDKVAQLPIQDQVRDELTYVEWPDLVSTIKEVGLVLLLSAVTGGLLINWDLFLRDTYTDFGWIPRPEDIGTQFEGLELPEGWTDMMSDDDLASLPDKVADTAAAVGSAVNSAMGDIPGDL
jgi:preprotein translocase subunit SecE